MKKILYIEDNRDTARAVQLILQTLGYKIDLAYTGNEGLAKLRAGNYSLVIFDLMLPDSSGMELFEKVKGTKNNCKFAFLSIIPISVQKKEELLKEGVVDYLTKPFKKDDLVMLLEKTFGRVRTV